MEEQEYFPKINQLDLEYPLNSEMEQKVGEDQKSPIEGKKERKEDLERNGFSIRKSVM